MSSHTDKTTCPGYVYVLVSLTHAWPKASDDEEEKQQLLQHKDSHPFCIIGVGLRFPYYLMCEAQPEAPQHRVVHVDILYTTDLTRPVEKEKKKGKKSLDETNQSRQEHWYMVVLMYADRYMSPYMRALASVRGKQMQGQWCVRVAYISDIGLFFGVGKERSCFECEL